jgi:alpha-tubulin suppressor-like RCC1 family protein
MLAILIGILTSVLAAQTAPPALSDEVHVATSATHTLVIAPDGRVLCQGWNQHAVCGVDPATTPYVDTLSPVPAVPKARAVAVADPWTSMVLGEDGRVYVWGQNNFGLFGGTDRGPTFVRRQPTVIAGIDRVVGIAAFEHGGAALRDDGTVWMWGEDTEGLLATGTTTLSGQSGKPYYTPRRVAGIDGVKQIAGGSKHMVALKSDGTVWVWGAARYWQLGLGDTERRGVPTKIPTLSGVTRVYAEDTMGAARLADGTWLVWGDMPSAEPPTDNGPPVRTPSPLPGMLRPASDVAMGVAAFPDGTVRTWGSNSFGTLGTGGSVDAVSRRGVVVKTLSGIIRVWSGTNRVLALKSDGTLYYWGVAGSADNRVLRVPTVMTKFTLGAPRQP